MTLAIDKMPMTVEELMNLPDSQDYELIDGNLVERNWRQIKFHRDEDYGRH